MHAHSDVFASKTAVIFYAHFPTSNIAEVLEAFLSILQLIAVFLACFLAKPTTIRSETSQKHGRQSRMASRPPPRTPRITTEGLLICFHVQQLNWELLVHPCGQVAWRGAG